MHYVIGIDAGSTITKGILYNNEIVRRHQCDSSARPLDSIMEVYHYLCAGLAVKPWLTITGYGRHLADFADKKVTEISCHAIGARYLCPSVRTVIDIGGQDSKVLRIDESGNLSDFLMNDKCAAGTGRFLDVIVRSLSASLETLDQLTHQVEPHPISNMCTVFAESEVISLRSKNVPPEVILSGILSSIVKRTANFAAHIGIEDTVFFTGGVSRSVEFRTRLSEAINKPILTSPLAQYAGAIGAAVMGYNKQSIQLG